MTMLQVQNLYKEFDGIKAVDNLSFSIEENSIVALVGPNGSGKTTVFNIVSGFLEVGKGKVILDAKDITSVSPDKIACLGIGRTFQNIRLFPQISALDNVMLGLKYETGDRFAAAFLQTRRMKKEEKKNIKKAEELLNFVGLTEKRDALAEDLSHGQRKLLELARILALEPKIFLLDEPIAGLFPETKRTMFGLIRKLKEKGKTVLFIEHDLHSVMDIAEKIIVLDHGKKIAEGMPDEIRQNKEVLKAYLGKECL
jgi:branched-chain amino acid transport system ATP-binding protein